MAKPLVYICSPFKGSNGDYESNRLKAIEYCKDAAAQGVIPLAPHTIFTQYLNDAVPEERNIGLQLGIDLLKDYCTEMWVYGDEISQGMQAEIDLCRANNIKVEFKDYRTENEQKQTAEPKAEEPKQPAQNIELVMFEPYKNSVNKLIKEYPNLEMAADEIVVANCDGSFAVVKSKVQNKMRLSWARLDIQKQQPITPLGIKTEYLLQLEEMQTRMTKELKNNPKLQQQFELAKQSAHYLPFRITLPELRNAVNNRLYKMLSYDYFERLITDNAYPNKKIESLLLDKNLMRYGLENAVAIRLQNPNATKLYTQMELSKLGIRVKKGQKPIYVYSTSVKAYFERNGKQVPTTDATKEEQLHIVSGKLPVNRQIQYGLNRVFDIEQFDLTKSQRQMLLDMEQKEEYTYEHLVEFAAMTRTAGSLGFKTKEEPMCGLPYYSCYEPLTNTIIISDVLSDEYKAAEIIKCLSSIVISKSSDSPDKLQTFETRMLSARLLTAFGKPIETDDAQKLMEAFRDAREFLSDISENKTSFTLENTLAKVNRAATYVIRGVDKVVESHMEQTQQQEVKQQQKQYQTQTPAQQQGVTTDELVNFIQQIQ